MWAATETPPHPMDTETVVIAVEANPRTASGVPHVPNRYVLTAAMSDSWGITTYNDYDGSGSLLKHKLQPLGPKSQGVDRQVDVNRVIRVSPIVVPTLPLSAVLQLGQGLDCFFLKIDAQGMDYRIAKSAGQALDPVSILDRRDILRWVSGRMRGQRTTLTSTGCP